MRNVDNMGLRMGKRYLVFWKDDIMKKIMHKTKVTDNLFSDWKEFWDNEMLMENLEENHLEDISLDTEVNIWGCKKFKSL